MSQVSNLRNITGEFVVKREIVSLLMVIAVLALAHMARPGLAVDSEAFSKKAGELCAGKKSRAEKIVAVYEFTRDDIRQIKTSYA